MSSLESDPGGNSCESVGSYSFIHDLKPCKGNSSSPNLVPDAKWWLNHHGLEKGYFLDQLNVLETDGKFLAASHLNGNAEAAGENKLIEEYCNSDPKNHAAFCSDMPLKHFCSHCKSNGRSCSLGSESTVIDDFFSNTHLMDLDSCNCLLFEQPEKLHSELDSHWIGVKKIEPWWHAVDRDDSESLVSQTSSHHNRNCDHPGVWSMHVEKVSENCIFCEEQITDKETKVSRVADCTQGDFASVTMDKSLGKQGLVESILQESDQSFSGRNGLITEKVESSDTQEPSSNLSRAQLMEALCHSQTRAREAEKLAQEACDEKDHIINLFFQQATCLFAYRQWLRMLQLEALLLHIRSKDQLSSFATPSLLPWVRSKGVALRKNRCRTAKKKLSKPRCNISKCTVAFAIGLSLAGAGLLVGWTIGWLFPAF